MSGLRRPLGLVLALSLCTPAAPARPLPDEVGDAFAKGVEMLQRGRDEDALRAFEQVLALDPSSERTLELWQAEESGVVMTLLAKGGEYEKVGRALLELVRAGRAEMRDDPEAIRSLLDVLVGGGVADRREALYRLRSEHGEYAVPRMLHALGDSGDDDRRVAYLHALSEMGPSVVPPLVAALETDDDYVRRNVAITLGLIGDSRAAAALARVAESREVTRAAAQEALRQIGVTGSAATLYGALGRAYLTGEGDVLASYNRSEVLWNWGEKGLESREVPGFLYGPELAVRASLRALEASGASLESRAGVALASAAVAARIAASQSPDEWADRARSARMALDVAGPDAVDVALFQAMDIGDVGAAILLARTLGETARSATTGLDRAVAQEASAGLRGEAAAALARFAVRSGQMASAVVVNALGEAASRASLRIVAVVDGDGARASRTVEHLGEMGVHAYAFPTGGEALVGLRRLPGVDAILLADSLPDLTTDQVLDTLRRSAKTEDTPVLILTQDADRADELYGGKSQGTVTSEADLAAVPEVLDELEGERGRASELARRAAEALAALGATGTDLSGVAGPLAASLEANHNDGLVTSALNALATCGTPSQADAVAAVLADDGRDAAVRAAAARALGGIFGREARVGDETRATLVSVAMAADSSELRSAALAALGRLELPADVRTEILRSLK